MPHVKTGHSGRFIFCMVLSGSLFVLPVLSGWASSQKTTRTETTVTQANGQTPQVSQREAKTETVTTTEAKRPESVGIVGGLFHVIGTVLAFPFKVIGKLLEAIF